MTAPSTFADVALGLTTDPARGRPIADRPFLILVGVTGVGKSTVLQELAKTGYPFSMLPDRRTLTDDLIIAPLQAEDGVPQQPVMDRAKRFEYTRRYRQKYPGGMAHALSQLRIERDDGGSPLCFDGLRGEEEVRHAAEKFPSASFAVLDAPDLVRVERLVRRRDGFDHIEVGHKTLDTALIDIPGVNDVFDADDLQYLRSLAEQGKIDPEELRAKVAIVVSERRNYDPAAAIDALQSLAPDRTLIIDTSACTPAEAARRILVFWHRSQGTVSSEE